MFPERILEQLGMQLWLSGKDSGNSWVKASVAYWLDFPVGEQIITLQSRRSFLTSTKYWLCVDGTNKGVIFTSVHCSGDIQQNI